MAEVGKKNKLRVLKKVDFGFYLDGENLGEILIPNRYVQDDCKIDDELEIFISFDSEDRIVATTEEPYAQVDECAHLQVIAIGEFGAFMDWGLSKDLLVPFKEQRVPMREGQSYTVFIFIDATGRIAASSKLSSFLREDDGGRNFAEDQIVSLQIASRSDLGYKAVIDSKQLGLIHNSDILSPINVGDIIDGYIKKIRDDGRIDLTLQAKGKEARDSLSKDILEFLEAEGGSCDITDKSPPELIYKTFNVSKKNYKKALGKLYKERLIIVDKNEIRLA